MTKMPEMIARMVDAYTDAFSKAGIEITDKDFLRYLARTILETIEQPTETMLKIGAQARPQTPDMIWAFMMQTAIHAMPPDLPSTD